MNNNQNLILILAGLSFVLLIVLFSLPPRDVINSGYSNELQERLSELNVIHNLTKDSLLEQRKTSDSLILLVELLQKEKEQIKAKYEKIRRDINNMSIDEHIEFIGTAISREDSITR